MRVATVAFLLSLSPFFAACTNNTGTDGGTDGGDAAVAATIDMTTVATVDMTVTAIVDMTVIADLSPYGCKSTALCAAACGATVDGGPSSAQCLGACLAGASDAGVANFDGVLGCGYGICLKSSDAGAASCTSQTDTSPACFKCVLGAAESMACSAALTNCTMN